MIKVALLIPTTSKNRDSWKNIRDTYLYKLTINTVIRTYDKDYEYVFYLGYDKDDRIFSKKDQQDIITKITTIFKNMTFKFIEFNQIEKGYLTKMWNILFKCAYDDGCNYFYQTGDDISFKTEGWTKASIEALVAHNDIGLSGPINNNPRILTQCMVGRSHMKIFGWFFPEEIKNWGCVDWYNFVYQPNYFYPIQSQYCSNDGGTPRYEINNDPMFTSDFNSNLIKLRRFALELANKYRDKIEKFLQSIN